MKEFASIHAETMFHEADKLIDENKYGEAYLILESLIKQDPPFGKAYNHLGWFYQWKAKDLAKAEEYYKKAIEIIPQYYASYSNYILLLSAQQRWKEMLALIDKAMNVPGAQRGTLYKELGVMHEKQGSYEEAIEAYKKFAVESTEDSKFDEAMKSIERCKEKMKVLR
jgi:tetratricopeptide (TPR) repeat protein